MEASLGTTVRTFVVDNYLFGDEAGLPADEESLIETGVVDSTGVLELIEFLEETFGVTVGESETIPQNLGSISNIVTYLAQKLNGSGPAVTGSS